MPETPIGQRLKILIDSLKLDVRTFSQRIDVAETTTRNYLNRGTKPGTEYLEKVHNSFNEANLHWLLTGKGEPLLTDTAIDQSTTATIKKNSGIVGSNGTQLNFGVPSTFDDCKQQLAVLTAENEGLRSTVAALETALSAKEEILTLLRGGYTRPN